MKKKITNSFKWVFIGIISNQLVGFVITVILARLLVPEDFGLLAMIVAFSSLVSGFVNLGFSSAIIQAKQIDKKENWRRIIDFKNNSGWIHWSQLKKINSIIPLEDKILFKKPSYFSKPLAKIKKGRVLIVQKCDGAWCKIKSENFNGWVKTDNIWGSVN